jgi:hypothetical protein
VFSFAVNIDIAGAALNGATQLYIHMQLEVRSLSQRLQADEIIM